MYVGYMHTIEWLNLMFIYKIHIRQKQSIGGLILVLTTDLGNYKK